MSLMVDDQDRALNFYTEVLGFRKNKEFPVGAYKWLTVVSPDGPNDIELTLEPNANPAAKTFQQAMFSQRIPLAAFEVGDIANEHARLKSLGVVFTTEPTRTGPVTIAVFSDTVGNLIQIYQPPS
jgi:glyoxylase I family protein